MKLTFNYHHVVICMSFLNVICQAVKFFGVWHEAIYVSRMFYMSSAGFNALLATACNRVCCLWWNGGISNFRFVSQVLHCSWFFSLYGSSQVNVLRTLSKDIGMDILLLPSVLSNVQKLDHWESCSHCGNKEALHSVERKTSSRNRLWRKV
jgi:hypothetical protein